MTCTHAEPSEEAAVAEPAIKPEDVPCITVDEPAVENEEEQTGTLKKKRENKGLAVTKPLRKLPDQGVEMKGYIHRKRQGLGTRWDKTYCVLTYQALYFTTMQDNTEYSSMLSLTTDLKANISEKKGHDKKTKVFVCVCVCVCVRVCMQVHYKCVYACISVKYVYIISQYPAITQIAS